MHINPVPRGGLRPPPCDKLATVEQDKHYLDGFLDD